MELVENTINRKTYDLNSTDIDNAVRFAFANGFPVPLIDPSDVVAVTHGEEGFRVGHPIRVIVTHVSPAANGSD